MAINPHDDYEALAKLLYPSIEASGNVYYGQTRKLAVDELFDKNNAGFHSHIESQYNDTSKEYDTFFCWELGPLKGIIAAPEILPTAPMCFAKYKLVFTTNIIDNNLNSGVYNSYERSISAVFSDIEKTYGKIPVHNTAWDGANFYIIEEDSVWYLYIAIKYSNIITDLVDPEPYEYTPPPYKDGDEFTITNLSDEADVSVELKLNGSLDNTDVYQYFIVDSSSDWADLVLDTPVTVVGASKIKFRCKPGVIKSDQTSSNFLRLQITGANAALSGDFRSLQENKESVKNFEFSRFLRQNNTVVDARDLIIPIAGFYAFEYLFFTCINLKYPPQLPASTLSHYCYYNMFFNCGSLLVAPELPAVNLMPHCYANMFSGCTQLSRVQDYFKVKYLNSYTLAYSFISMFRNCKSLQVAPCIICDSLQATSCNGMFYGCTSLKTARIIVTDNLKDDMYSGSNFKRSYCFKDMFKDCTSLTDVYLECPLYTEFETQYESVGLCQEMFSGCTNLRRIFCYMPQKWISRNDNYTDWLEGVSSSGEFYYDTEYEDTLPNENKFPESDSGIPSGWERRNIYEKYSNGEDSLKFCDEREYILASGTNNKNNGRGDITDQATLANMEKSFDENNSHQMNTYNEDGSFNQEVWGYKSFCSPVQFRNGVYTDTLSILSTYDSGKIGSDIDFTSTGSTIRSSDVNGLEISLKNSKYHDNSNSDDSEEISFLVPLHGYANSEKSVNCSATLRSVSDYDYNNDSYTVVSDVSSSTTGEVASSSIITLVNSGSRGTVMAASVEADCNKSEPKVTLSVLDVSSSVSSSLVISKSGSKFTGDIEADSISLSSARLYDTLFLGDAEISTYNNNLIISSSNNIIINNYIEMLDGLYVEGDFHAVEGLLCGGDSNFIGAITADSGITSHGDIVVDNGKKFIGNLDGVIPHAESFVNTVPVGCIVFLRIKNTSELTGVWSIGSMLTSGNSSYELSIGCFSETGVNLNNSSSPLAEGQTFRTLSQCVFNSNIYTHVLAIRVS